MGMALFILSVLIILVPVVWIFRSKSGLNFGLALSKGWIVAVFVAELILLILVWIDYSSTPPDVATDFLWHNLFLYHRGVLPIVGIMSLVDFAINANSIATIIFVYIAALIVDYLILLIFTYLKSKLKRKPVE